MYLSRSTNTATATVEAYPNSALFAAIELPTYILGYPPTRISSACSCLSVPPTTETVTASYSTVVSYRSISSSHKTSMLTAHPLHQSVRSPNRRHLNNHHHRYLRHRNPLRRRLQHQQPRVQSIHHQLGRHVRLGLLQYLQ